MGVKKSEACRHMKWESGKVLSAHRGREEGIRNLKRLTGLPLFDELLKFRYPSLGTLNRGRVR